MAPWQKGERKDKERGGERRRGTPKQSWGIEHWPHKNAEYKRAPF